MTTLPQQDTIFQYLANGTQTAFVFAFYAPLPTDISVYLTQPNVAPNPSTDKQTLNVTYSVAFNVDPITGGTITFNVAPVAGAVITIAQTVVYSLTTNFAAAQNFNGANLDNELIRLLLLIQQNYNYITQRNLSYIFNSYLPNPNNFAQLPKLGSNQVWVGTGGAVTVATLGNASVNLFYGAGLYMANNQTLNPNSNTVVTFDTVNFDAGALVSLANHGFIINKQGYYWIAAQVYASNPTSSGSALFAIYQNGVGVKSIGGQAWTGVPMELNGGAIVYCMVGDVIQAVVGNGNSSNALLTAGSVSSNFEIQFIGQ